MPTEEVPEALAGERLDRFVSMVIDCSRKTAAELIEQGQVTVDGRKATAGKVKVVLGETISIVWDGEPEETPPAADPSIAFDVVHEDDSVIVVDKPDGVIVHPGAGNPGGTLVNGLLARFPDIAEVGDRMRPGIVHRLDKGTTGLLVVARTPEAYESLVDQLAVRCMTRRYITVCWGSVDNERGVIDAAIGRSNRQRTRMMVSAEGREARTRYEVVGRRSFDPIVSLLRCRLETGRTHQIRVHLDAIGHPVVGDDVYGGVRGSIEFGRPALHAELLGFSHPESGEPVEFHSPRPADFAALVRQLLPGL